MRFLARVIGGFAFVALGLAAAGYGAMTLLAGMEGKGGRERPAQEERVYAVTTAKIANGAVRPEITTYGSIRAWRTLEIRAKTAGYVVDVAEGFRDGAMVEAGAPMFRIDPEEYAAAEADARIAVTEAEAELAEAEQALEVVLREMEAAETQRKLRASALERQQGLLSRGVTTSTAVEEAEMGLAVAEQTAAGRAQALLAAQIRIDRAGLKLRRAEIAHAEARRDLAQTEHVAPFPGLLDGVSIALGALAAPNEKFGELIDPASLEAAFRLTNAQFARLIGPDGALRPVEVEVTLELDRTPLTIRGVVDRPGARIEAGETGRLVYARLDVAQATLLRAGDFVTVAITEPPLEDVARVPASAVSEAGEILLVGEDDRLAGATVEIMRRVGDEVLIAGAPDGAVYVTERAPQLGPGVRVRRIEPAAGDDGGAAPPGDDTAATGMIDLAPDRQQRLIDRVEANQRMPAPVKERILATLRTGRAPQAMVDRIEQRRGG